MVVVTEEKATILMEHLLQNDSALINGHPRGGGGKGVGSIPLGAYVGMVHWIC